jgi:Protein of unknown function (DUF3592)
MLMLGIMGPLGDNTPLTNILVIAAAAVIGVGVWFLIWHLVDLLPAKLRGRAVHHDEMDTLRAAVVTQQQLAIQFGGSDAATVGADPGSPRRRAPSVWAACLFLVIALGMGIGAIAWLVNTVAFVSSAVSVPGTVVDLVRSSGCAACYAPRVLFKEKATGDEIDFLDPVSTSDHPHVGEEVTVLYSPEWPQHARVQRLSSIWGGIITLSGLSIGFAVAGVCALLFPNAVTYGPSGFVD